MDMFTSYSRIKKPKNDFFMILAWVCPFKLKRSFHSQYQLFDRQINKIENDYIVPLELKGAKLPLYKVAV